ncbi:hypothetical protein GCM10025738_25730 [Microbacterium fluvii]
MDGYGVQVNRRILAAGTGSEKSSKWALRQMGIGVCSTAIVTFVESAVVFGEPIDEVALSQHEEVFPGISVSVYSTIEDMRGIGSAPETFNYDITSFGSSIKLPCATSVAETE